MSRRAAYGMAVLEATFEQAKAAENSVNARESFLAHIFDPADVLALSEPRQYGETASLRTRLAGLEDWTDYYLLWAQLKRAAHRYRVKNCKGLFFAAACFVVGIGGSFSVGRNLQGR